MLTDSAHLSSKMPLQVHFILLNSTNYSALLVGSEVLVTVDSCKQPRTAPKLLFVLPYMYM